MRDSVLDLVVVHAVCGYEIDGSGKVFGTDFHVVNNLNINGELSIITHISLLLALHDFLLRRDDVRRLGD